MNLSVVKKLARTILMEEMTQTALREKERKS
jgi:hypothetical protein